MQVLFGIGGGEGGVGVICESAGFNWEAMRTIKTNLAIGHWIALMLLKFLVEIKHQEVEKIIQNKINVTVLIV